MTSPNNPQSASNSASSVPQPSPSRTGEMAKAMELVEAIRELSEQEMRFVFRELAKNLLDPNADELFLLCDNEKNLLGYFEPALHHFRTQAEPISRSAESKEDFLSGSVSAEEFLH